MLPAFSGELKMPPVRVSRREELTDSNVTGPNPSNKDREREQVLLEFRKCRWQQEASAAKAERQRTSALDLPLVENPLPFIFPPISPISCCNCSSS